MAVSVKEPGQKTEKSNFAVEQREYRVQRIDGTQKKYVSPPAPAIKKIKADNRKIGAVRFATTDMEFFTSQFIWPAEGPISGVYGGQRVLNGEPKRPHFGVDIAARPAHRLSRWHPA